MATIPNSNKYKRRVVRVKKQGSSQYTARTNYHGLNKNADTCRFMGEQAAKVSGNKSTGGSGGWTLIILIIVVGIALIIKYPLIVLIALGFCMYIKFK